VVENMEVMAMANRYRLMIWHGKVNVPPPQVKTGEEAKKRLGDSKGPAPEGRNVYSQQYQRGNKSPVGA
jgi:hypothetical protein